MYAQTCRYLLLLSFPTLLHRLSKVALTNKIEFNEQRMTYKITNITHEILHDVVYIMFNDTIHALIYAIA